MLIDGQLRTPVHTAGFIKRLFEAGAVTRVLFLVDRIPLAKQTEEVSLSTSPHFLLTCCGQGGAFRMRSGSRSPRCKAW
jgi:hypothetical protein